MVSQLCTKRLNLALERGSLATSANDNSKECFVLYDETISLLSFYFLFVSSDSEKCDKVCKQSEKIGLRKLASLSIIFIFSFFFQILLRDESEFFFIEIEKNVSMKKKVASTRFYHDLIFYLELSLLFLFVLNFG